MANCRNCLLIVVSIVFLEVFRTCRAQDFGYDGEKGPTHWGEQYNTCFGKHQSPIDIDLHLVQKVNLPELEFYGFDDPPTQMNLTNNGHTVMVTMESVLTPTIYGGPLNGEYVYSQLHFHWGDNDTFGSEDTIDGRVFPMELHMVFYKKLYGTPKAAMANPDGLAVLAFFYEISETANDYYGEFIQLLANVTRAENEASFKKPPPLKDLMSQNLVNYYTYNGSLTTPPCSEVVTWIDFKDPIMLSHEQVQAFRALENEEGHPLTHNFRPIQPLGDRVILYNTEEVVKNQDLDYDSPTKDIDNSIEEGRAFGKGGATSLTLSLTSFSITVLGLLCRLFFK